MRENETKDVELRSIPANVDYYDINPDGTLSESTHASASVYIDEFDVHFLSDKEKMLYIRENYGSAIGVMHDIDFSVFPREAGTSKMLLGVLSNYSQGGDG